MLRRKFTKECKRLAVESWVAGSPLDLVCQGCGASPHALRRWRREFSRYGEQAFPGPGRNRLSRKQRTLSLVFRLSAEEYLRVQSAYLASHARNFSDFARGEVLGPREDHSIARLEEKLNRLAAEVKKLAASA